MNLVYSLRIAWAIISCAVIITYYTIFYNSMVRMRATHASDDAPTVIPNEMFRHLARGVLTTSLYDNGFHGTTDTCPQSGQGMTLLIGVLSRFNHKTKRMSIRKTWGHYNLREDVGIVFIYGARNKDETYEMDVFRDVVVEPNEDTDVNESLKTISLMEFVTTRCPKVKYVLKTVDDMYINVPLLLTVASSLNESHRAFYGHVMSNVSTERDATSVGFMSQNQYSPSTLPNFISGEACLLPGYLAREIYSEVLHQYYVPTEAVFISGIMAEILNVRRVNLGGFIGDKIVRLKSNANITQIVAIRAELVSRQYKLWTMLNNNVTGEIE